MLKWLKKLFSIPAPKYSERSPKELSYKFKQDIVSFGFWMERNIWWVKDRKTADEWKSPEQTLTDGKGDCEDFARLAFATLREMGCAYAEILCLYPVKGQGHAICVFRGFSTPYLWWYSNGELQEAVKPSSDHEADLKLICEISAEKQGWKLGHWRHTGFKI